MEDDLPSAIILLQDAKGKVSLLNMDDIFYINREGNEVSLREAQGFENLAKHLSIEFDENELRCWVFTLPGLGRESHDDIIRKLTTA